MFIKKLSLDQSELQLLMDNYNPLYKAIKVYKKEDNWYKNNSCHGFQINDILASLQSKGYIDMNGIDKENSANYIYVPLTEKGMTCYSNNLKGNKILVITKMDIVLHLIAIFSFLCLLIKGILVLIDRVEYPVFVLVLIVYFVVMLIKSHNQNKEEDEDGSEED